jgi:hypothetical protein
MQGLIGTSFIMNGKFAWVGLYEEDFGWNRESENVGNYRIVKVESNRKTIVLVMLKGIQFEDEL